MNPASHHAIVVFENRQDSRWLRLLRPGFQHCFCVLRAEQGWVVVDPLLYDLRITWIDLDAQVDLSEHYRNLGRIVATGMASDLLVRKGNLRPLTCVEVVKRALGLGALPAWTPWQLYRALLGMGWTGHGTH